MRNTPARLIPNAFTMSFADCPLSSIASRLTTSDGLLVAVRDTSLGLGLGDPFPLPLQHQLPLELGDGPNRLTMSFPLGVPVSRFIDRIRSATLFFERPHDCHQVGGDSHVLGRVRLLELCQWRRYSHERSRCVGSTGRTPIKRSQCGRLPHGVSDRTCSPRQAGDGVFDVNKGLLQASLVAEPPLPRFCFRNRSPICLAHFSEAYRPRSG